MLHYFILVPFFLSGVLCEAGATSATIHDKDADSQQLNIRRVSEKDDDDKKFWARFLQGTSGSMVAEPTAVPIPVTRPTVAPTSFPTRSLSAQDELVTCISVIDENDDNIREVENLWPQLRQKFPQRPFCLLRPIPAGGGLAIPSSFLNDTLTIYRNVTRDQQDMDDPSDWYDICNLEAGKSLGLTNVVLFVDNSGSMYTGNVMNAFNLFQERVDENGFEIVMKNENIEEDYITPCLDTSLVM